MKKLAFIMVCLVASFSINAQGLTMEELKNCVDCRSAVCVKGIIEARGFVLTETILPKKKKETRETYKYESPGTNGTAPYKDRITYTCSPSGYFDFFYATYSNFIYTTIQEQASFFGFVKNPYSQEKDSYWDQYKTYLKFWQTTRSDDGTVYYIISFNRFGWV